MSEQSPAPIKHPDLSGLPRGAISIRGLPLGRNTRLPSIRGPRDLTLGAQPKRVFTPKIPVRREKKEQEAEPQTPQPPVNTAKAAKPNSASKWQKKDRVIIQTEGSLFGEGIAAKATQNVDRKDPVPRFTSRKLNIKKEFDVSDLSSDLNGLLRDDFIDDDDEYDEKEDIKPTFFPDLSRMEMVKKEASPKKKFDENFAKGLGFDVKQIAKFIKQEKSAEVSTLPRDESVETDPDNEMYNLLKRDEPQLFLLQFPKLFATEQMEDLPRNPSNSSAEQKNTKAKIKVGLAALPEGQIGKLQVLKSGRTRLVIGENCFDLDFSNPVVTRNEVVSIQTNTPDKDMIVLGNIDRKIIVTPAVNELLESAR